MNQPTVLSFVLYLAGMLVIGVVAYRATRTLSDFVIGGRRLGGFVTALSAGASGMSGWLLLGLPGAFYLLGLNQIWMAIGLVLGAYVNWTVVSPRLRRFTELADNALTLSDYFEARFGDRSRLLRVTCALVTLIFFTIYTASGLVSGAVLFSATFGISYHVALWIGAVMIISYTFLGGFLAVSWTDVVQGLLMLLALILVPAVSVQEMGGWNMAIEKVGTQQPGHLSAFSGLSAISALSLTAWGLGYFGQPHILARFMAMRAASDMPTARAIGMSWMIACLYGAMMSGFLAVGYFEQAPLDNPETAFIVQAQALLTPWLAGIVLAAVLAAIMSTADSQLIVSTSALTEDFYRPFVRKNASDNELLMIGRIGVLVIALIALVIGRDPESRILEIVAYAWAGLGAGFGPSVLLSLIWRRMTRNGTLAGMVTGSATVVVWANLEGGLFDVYEILPGFLFGLIAIIAISLTGRPPESAARFFEERRLASQPDG